MFGKTTLDLINSAHAPYKLHQTMPNYYTAKSDPGGRFKYAYEVLNRKALKIAML